MDAANDLRAIAQVHIDASAVPTNCGYKQQMIIERFATMLNDRFVIPFQDSSPLFTTEDAIPCIDIDRLGECNHSIMDWAKLAFEAQRHRERTSIIRSLHQLCVTVYGKEWTPPIHAVFQKERSIRPKQPLVTATNGGIGIFSERRRRRQDRSQSTGGPLPAGSGSPRRPNGGGDLCRR